MAVEAEWTRSKKHGGSMAVVDGWTARECMSDYSHGTNGDLWTFHAPDGRTWECRSKSRTALRRFAHLLMRGEWNRLTVDSYNVPQDIDSAWRDLIEGYDNLDPGPGPVTRANPSPLRALRQREPRAEWCYLIRHPSTGLLKVGKSVHVERRVRTLSLQGGAEMDLLGTIPNSGDVERSLHAQFRADRVIGEWFNDSEDLRAAFGVEAPE